MPWQKLAIFRIKATFFFEKIGQFKKTSYFCIAKRMKVRFLWMFHGVMAALEFLVLSVPVRIGVEQLPLPLESCSSFLYARLKSSAVST